MAEGVKTMFRIAKKLEESFKLISFYSSRYLVKSSKYRGEYLNQYKKITGKMKKDSKRERMRQKIKYKQQREKMKREMLRLKQRKDKERQKDKHDDKDRNKDRQRQRSRDRQRQKDKSRHQNRDKDRQRQRHRSNHRDRDDRSSHRDDYRRRQSRDKDRNREKSSRKDRDDSIQRKEESKSHYRQRHISENRDRGRDSDRTKQKPLRYFNEEDENLDKAEKKDQYDIFENFGKAKNGNNSAPKKIGKWSENQYDYFGCLDSDKYKILKVDEDQSDFQQDDAPIKVPFIKPRQPLTPYFLFLRQKRYVITQSYPELKEHQMSGTLGKVWKNLPTADKQPYKAEYERAMKIYQRMLSEYNQMNPEAKNVRQEQIKQIEEAARVSCARKNRKQSSKKPKGKEEKGQETKKKGGRPKKKQQNNDE